MKKVTFQTGIRALGDYNDDFFVEDNVSKEEIRRMIEDKIEYYLFFDVEEGYHKVQETKYVKDDEDDEWEYDC